MNVKQHEKGNLFIWFIIGIALSLTLTAIANAQVVTPVDVILQTPIKQPILKTSEIVQLVDTVAVSDLPDLQQQYFSLQGEYLQVPDKVNVYESPEGLGYQTVEYLKNQIIYTGYGPNAKDYTYSYDIPEFVASSSASIGGAGL